MLLNTQIITLSASANKLWKIRDRADEYTALIMEELDPGNIGYIEVNRPCFYILLYAQYFYIWNIFSTKIILVNQPYGYKLKKQNTKKVYTDHLVGLCRAYFKVECAIDI